MISVLWLVAFVWFVIVILPLFCHAHGYAPKEKDLRDMELLEARFGVELPSHLRRQT